MPPYRRAGAVAPDAPAAAVVPQAGQLPGQEVPPLQAKTEAGLIARPHRTSSAPRTSAVPASALRYASGPLVLASG
ncbi:MAG: hypothetical protein QM303_02185 [Bacillota bacterium]|nr:hypothetical protein [Bacillota bacterium]